MHCHHASCAAWYWTGTCGCWHWASIGGRLHMTSTYCLWNWASIGWKGLPMTSTSRLWHWASIVWRLHMTSTFRLWHWASRKSTGYRGVTGLALEGHEIALRLALYLLALFWGTSTARTSTRRRHCTWLALTGSWHCT